MPPMVFFIAVWLSEVLGSMSTMQTKKHAPGEEKLNLI
jgi:hypothetical protein